MSESCSSSSKLLVQVQQSRRIMSEMMFRMMTRRPQHFDELQYGKENVDEIPHFHSLLEAEKVT